MGLGTRDTGEDSEQSEKSTFDSRRSQSGLDAPESSGMGSGLTDNQTSQSGADPPDSSGMGDGLTVNRISKSGIDRTDSTGMGSSLTGNRSSGSSPSGPSQTAKGLENPEDHFGMDVPNEGVLQRLRANERMHGSRVQGWVDEGMPTDIMGNTRDMKAFRKRQADRPAEVPTDIERQNAHSVQRNAKAAADTGPAGDTGAPGSVRSVISSSGQSLDGSIKTSMESRMGESFDDVQIHTGPQAAAACEDIDARAFTVGNHVAFNHGEYDPGSPEGQHVIAHELAHVRQQTGGAVSMLPQEGGLQIDPDPTAEREAEETAQRVMEGGELGIQRLADTEVHVQRAPKKNRAAQMTAQQSDPPRGKAGLAGQKRKAEPLLQSANSNTIAAEASAKKANAAKGRRDTIRQQIETGETGGGRGVDPDVLQGSILDKLADAKDLSERAQEHKEQAETHKQQAMTAWNQFMGALKIWRKNLDDHVPADNNIRQGREKGVKGTFGEFRSETGAAIKQHNASRKSKRGEELAYKNARAKDEILDPQNRPKIQNKFASRDIKANNKLNESDYEATVNDAIHERAGAYGKAFEARQLVAEGDEHDPAVSDRINNLAKEVVEQAEKANAKGAEAKQKAAEAEKAATYVEKQLEKELKNEAKRSKRGDYKEMDERGEWNVLKRLAAITGDAGIGQIVGTFLGNINAIKNWAGAGWHAMGAAGMGLGSLVGIRNWFGASFDKIPGLHWLGSHGAAAYANMSWLAGVTYPFLGGIKTIAEAVVHANMNWWAFGMSVGLGVGSAAVGYYYGDRGDTAKKARRDQGIVDRHGNAAIEARQGQRVSRSGGGPI